MPMLTFGGYDATGDLVAPTRLTRIDGLSKITSPNLSLDEAPLASARFHDIEIAAAFESAVGNRLRRVTRHNHLPARQRALNRLFTARMNQEDMLRFARNFDSEHFDQLNISFERQIYVALLGFQERVATSAALVINGWDSHGTNDAQQARLMGHLFRGLGYLREQARSRGLTSKLNVVISSEFSRTPYYNNLGKDHHPVGSWMTMLWGLGLENGVRVVGETDENIHSVPVNATIAREGQDDEVVSTKLTPSIIHNELRDLAGLSASGVLRGLELSEPRVRLWG